MMELGPSPSAPRLQMSPVLPSMGQAWELDRPYRSSVQLHALSSFQYVTSLQ